MLPLVAAARLIHVRPRSAPQFRTGRGKGTGREGEAEAMLSVISNSFRERRPSSRRLLARSARTGINIRPRLSEETSSSPPSFPFSLSLVVFYILVRSREDAATRGENNATRVVLRGTTIVAPRRSFVLGRRGFFFFSSSFLPEETEAATR